MAWLGDSYYIVTTGYNKQSNREVLLRDIRNIDNVVYTITADNVGLPRGSRRRAPAPSPENEASSNVLSSMAYLPASTSPTTSPGVFSERKPSLPRFTPSTGMPLSPIIAADERNVPSPPTLTNSPVSSSMPRSSFTS